MLRNSEFSEEKIPVARFEWQPLVTGNTALPEISLTATSYNGSRVELSMPDSYVQIVPPVADENDFSGEDTFFAYAFTKLPEKSAVSVKQAVSPDDCRTIATLREKERNELPFGEARRERIAFERQCGIRNAENEPTYFVRNTLMSVYFCGGSCVEDVTSQLMRHLSYHPTLLHHFTGSLQILSKISVHIVFYYLVLILTSCKCSKSS